MEETKNKIAVLPDELINQIAAGEVVERPASVVKEIVENSLDAASSSIEVLLRNGGTSEITVIDNGEGISGEDLSLCIQRHATSKIKHLEDLESIGSFGFRGEALASIASVSQLEIRSRRQGQPKAHGLTIDFGKPGEILPVGAPNGTYLSIKNLFHNVPARQKFLRSPATEYSHCAKILKEIALGNAGVRFQLSHQGRLTQQFVTNSREERLKECLKFDWSPLHLYERGDGVELEAFLSPVHHIQDRADLYLYVNSRPVRNRVLFAAVKNAYQNTLGPHHQPTGVLFLDIRKDWVDVNVHPQKLEVRFLKEERFYSWLSATIRKAIAQTSDFRQIRVAEIQAPAYGQQNKAPPSPPTWQSSQSSSPSPTPIGTFSTRLEASSPASVSALGEQQTTISSPHQEGTLFEQLPAEDAPIQELHYLGQVLESYLLCSDSDGLVIVDQHALHEKMAFEKLRKQIQGGPMPIQQLLIPKIVRLSADHSSLAEHHIELIQKLGFDIEQFGDGDIAIKSRPALLEETQVEPVFRALVDDLRTLPKEETQAIDEAIRPLLSTIACHSVVRANQKLIPEKAKALLRGFEQLREGWTCPHGRPIVFRLNYQTIKRYFERT